jgi:DNA-binding CsgD family transcriptional regulator
LLTLLSPHVCRAIEVSDALNHKTVNSKAFEATLNALSAGVYLTDRHGRIYFMNGAADSQVKAGDALRIENNHLCPVDRLARSTMSNAIAEATGDETGIPSGGLNLALPGAGGGGLVATILPLTKGERRNLCSTATVAVFVQDPVVGPRFPGEAFAKLYGLTGGELRVLLTMVPGLSVKEAAEVLGIGKTTAKTHLQHIHAKTGTSKQTELMYLFASSVPPVRGASQD